MNDCTHLHDERAGREAGACPLAEGGATVGASPLLQGKAADEPEGEQDDGQEDAQEGKAVLQHPNPAEREHPISTHRGRPLQVTPGPCPSMTSLQTRPKPSHGFFH